MSQWDRVGGWLKLIDVTGVAVAALCGLAIDPVLEYDVYSLLVPWLAFIAAAAICVLVALHLHTALEGDSARRRIVWRVFSALLFSMFIGCAFWNYRLYLIREEVIETPLRGVLIPANDPTPKHYCDEIPPDSLKVFFGDQVAVTSRSSAVILRIAGEDVLSFESAHDGIRLNAIVRDKSNNEVARITRNVFRGSQNKGYLPLQPDPHTVVVVGPQDEQLLRVRYLNPTTMRVFGIFNRKGGRPINVEHGIGIDEGNREYSANCYGNHAGPLFNFQ